jgi:hypothetical protein
MIKLSRDELAVWLEHPTTDKILSALKDKKAEYADHITNGLTVYEDSAERTAITTAKLIGMIAGIDTIFNFDANIEDDSSE